MNVTTLPPAADELRDAIAWYNEQLDGLGDEFVTEFEKTVQRITQLPSAWAELANGVKCCPMNRFPYGVLYALREDEIVIIAAMHLHRKPGYWEDRI